MELKHSQLLNEEDLQNELRRLKLENLELKQAPSSDHKSKGNRPNDEWFSKCLKDNDMMKYYTRYTPDTFEAIFKSLMPVKQHNNSALGQRHQFFLTLVKLAHNFGFQDIGYRCGVHRTTVSDYFYKWTNILVDRLYTKIVIWPEHKVYQKTMPMCFRENFYNLVSIIDCFEVEIATPHQPTDQTATFSTYKERNTSKQMLSAGPNGSVNFVSQCVPGRLSDKQIVLSSGYLDHLKPGDLVLADRGFTVETEVASRGARLVTPAFLRERKQFPETEVDWTRRVANVRIHIERIIGSIRQNWKILLGPINIDFLTSYEEDTAFIDVIVKVCCILNNLLPSAIPSD